MLREVLKGYMINGGGLCLGSKLINQDTIESSTFRVSNYHLNTASSGHRPSVQNIRQRCDHPREGRIYSKYTGPQNREDNQEETQVIKNLEKGKMGEESKNTDERDATSMS